MTKNTGIDASSHFPSPIGCITITCSRDGINRISLLTPQPAQIFQEHQLPLLAAAQDQLLQYLEGRRKVFDLPLDLSALTQFKRDLLALCAEIPYGETRSYGQLAARLGKVAASRAVGAALASNPILVVLPCHRVVAADGSLRGYAGGLNVKQTLLELEGHTIVSQKLA